MTNLIHNMHYTIGGTNVSSDNLGIVHHDIIYKIRVFRLAKYNHTNLPDSNCRSTTSS